MRGWCARVRRRPRSSAAGHVRVNGQRIDAASRAVRPGDVVTVALDRAVRVLKVAGFAERRGSAPDARRLWGELEPAGRIGRPRASRPGAEPGTGRPTKRERRAIVRLTADDEP